MKKATGRSDPKKATGRSDPKVRSRRIFVRIATGREQNMTLGCEEGDGAVRSDSKVATERFVAFRTRRGMLSQQDHRTRPIGPSRSQGLRLNLAEKGHVIADEKGKKNGLVWTNACSPATKNSST
ncbi:hypothetical protein Taro_027910 [Colocasia esculenta]|uniref:Uncharacterized protein n=1 Tax=Colocasia esculenta TaxID=4460 RepID=A0A843VVP5_COLES|nr:hypothetical protein [Colocasia esculenta]